MNQHRPHKGIIIAALSLLLGFFMAWFHTPLGSISPFDLVAGAASSLFGGVQNVLWLIPICAVLLLFNEFTPTHPLRGFERLLKLVPLFAWAFITFLIHNKASQFGGSTTGDFLLKSIAQVVDGGFYLTMLGVTWLFLLSFTSRKSQAQPRSGAPQVVTQSAPPAAPIARPVHTGPTPGQQLITLAFSNPKTLVATLVLVLVSWSVYALFIEVNPRADGKKMASAYCDCEKEYLTAQQKAKREYLDANNSGKSIKKQFTMALVTIGDNYTECRQQAKEIESKQRSSYIGDESAKAIFNEALTEQLGLWYTAETDNVAKLDQALLKQGFTRSALTPVPSQFRITATAQLASNSEVEAISVDSGPQVSVSTQVSVSDQSAAPVPVAEEEIAAGEETINESGIVASAKAFFYTSSDLSQARSAYCIRGDQLILREVVGKAVKATFTVRATDKSISGWMKRDQVSFMPPSQPRSAQAAAEDEEEHPSSTSMIGTWQGTLGSKPFTLQIDEVNGNEITGWNQVGNNRRPITGSFTDVSTPDTNVHFKLFLREPGTDKWDGKFALVICSSDIGTGPNFCVGTWDANNGSLSKKVEVKKE